MTEEYWTLGEIAGRIILPIHIMKRLKRDADLRGVSVAEEAAYRVSRSFQDDDADAAARRHAETIEQGE